MQGSKHYYTICKEEEKIVIKTRKLEKEEEGACIDCHKSITELSLFSGLIRRKENYI